MKKIIITFLIGIYFQTTFGQTLEKEEAANAFKEIVKCYYNKDCNKYSSFFGDSISVLNFTIDTLLSTNHVINPTKVCEQFDKVIAKTLTYENYLQNYSIEVLSYEEYSTKDKKTLGKYIHKLANGGFCLAYINAHNKYYRKNDYYVMGDIPKNNDNYLPSPYYLMLRKTKTGWKISGISLN
jgi:hypothetical protein